MLFRYLASCICLASLATIVQGTILQNGQERITDYPDTTIDASAYSFATFSANASELSYKGRWDPQHISFWSSPGLVFGFTGETVAITFGQYTISSTLIAYRIGGEDWQFTNVTAGATHLLVTTDTPGVDITYPVSPLTFEMRVTNWGYGVQVDSVHLAAGEKLIKIPNFRRGVEIIGDSLSSGMYTSYEGLSSFAYGIGAGLGNTEYWVTAYPGICVSDQSCWGNPRGQVHQWFYATDNAWRSQEIYGDNPPEWDFSKQQSPDIVIVRDQPIPQALTQLSWESYAFINLGTNDANSANNVTTETYVDAYKKLIEGVHGKYPDAQVVVMSLWIGFYAYGNSYAQNHNFDAELADMVKYFNSPQYLSAPLVWDGTTNKTSRLSRPSQPFVHLFNTTGIMQHNDIGPQWHPTDVGAIKVASHMIQWIKMTFGWELEATGPEIFHDTLYWNDQSSY